MKTIHEFDLDGFSALRCLVIKSGYRSLAQAIASLTVFSHPKTVAQTSWKAVFPIIRNLKRRGEVEKINGRCVGFDDNTSPTQAFMWANGLSKRGRDLQFNHVYNCSTDPECYTNLANLCITPTFLAKLTDTDHGIQEQLRYRAFDLYGWHPGGWQAPVKPEGYDDLNWADTIEPQSDVKASLKRRVAKLNNRTTKMIAQTGWHFEQGNN